MPQKELEAIKRACLYSIPPNKLGYCGPEYSWKKLEEFISNPSEENISSAKEQLQHFNALYPYLELIAEANSLQPFDPEVVEAYWLGNPLLENVPYPATQKAILSFQKLGLPKKIAEQKASLLPEGILPHHSMHVLFINFISQKVPALVQNLSNCLIQWGRVQETFEKSFIKNGVAIDKACMPQETLSQGISIKGIELISESNELKLREKAKTVENPFNLAPQPRDLVTVHWGNAIEAISPEQKKSLQKFTERTLACLRPQSPEAPL